MFSMINNNYLINPNIYSGFAGFGNSYPVNNYLGNSLFGNSIFGGYNNYNAGFGSSNLGQGNNILSLLAVLLGSLGGSSSLNIDDDILDSSSILDSSILEDTGVDTSAWGDPHFDLGGQRAFDFIGEDNGIYNLLDNKDISINARFVSEDNPDAAKLGIHGSDIKTVIGEENIEFKGTGVNIVANNNGQFEIFQNGKKIADQTNYTEVADKLEKLGIEFTDNAKNKYSFLNINYKGREISLGKEHGGMFNDFDLLSGDKGLQAQTMGALDDDLDGKTVGVIDVNGDGAVDDKDVLNYNLNNQVFLHTQYANNQTVELTEEVIKAIEKDFKSGKGAIASRFTGKGYTEAQWNEYLGNKLFAAKDKYLTA